MNQFDPTHQNQTHAPDNQEAPQSMSLLGGIARTEGLTEAEELELSGGGSGRSLNQGTILLIAVAVIAAGSLYVMRLAQGDLTAGSVSSQAEAKIEEALSKWSMPEAMAKDDPLLPTNLEALFRDTDGVIAMLASDYSDQQVPVEYVKKNPFALSLPETPVAAAPTDRNRAQRIKQLEQELARLRLQTVMKGRVPIAVIDGEMYRQGQQVGSFTIAEIDAGALRVTVAAEGQRFVLSMQSQ